ncbi:MAG: N-acyl homoserine lactonase family protein [Anaerolineae bacterium]|nr:N-acyl homoserine lactonase family protein [Anaerolineae bacterium]
MRIHIIQTGTVAIKQVQQQGRGSGNPVLNILLDQHWTEPLPIYAFVIEHPEGLIVVDTGETAQVAEPGYFPWWHPYYRFGVQEWVQPEEEIGPQMRALGFDPNEVHWVLLTHLHTDHAGGLAHFPQAEHLVSRREYEDAAGVRGRLRGYPSHRWPDWFRPTLIELQPEPVGPFPTSYPVTQAGDVRFVPTPGHTAGHLSVLVTTPDLTYFLAGDASYTQELMLRQQVDGVSNDRVTAQQTLEWVHCYCHTTSTVYLPSHDPDALDRLANRQVVAPTPALAVPITEAG